MKGVSKLRKNLKSNAKFRLQQSNTEHGAPVHILSHVRGSVATDNGFWIGWLDLLTPYSHKSYLQAIQRYRWFTQFIAHRHTRTRILRLH
jgi:hypothetical protein